MEESNYQVNGKKLLLQLNIVVEALRNRDTTMV